jgi:hypothetical protein
MARTSYFRHITRQPSTSLPILKPPPTLFGRKKPLEFSALLSEIAALPHSGLRAPAEAPAGETLTNTMQPSERSGPVQSVSTFDTQDEKPVSSSTLSGTIRSARVHIQPRHPDITPELEPSGERHPMAEGGLVAAQQMSRVDQGAPSESVSQASPTKLGPSASLWGPSREKRLTASGSGPLAEQEASTRDQRASSEPASHAVPPIRPPWSEPGSVTGSEALEPTALPAPAKFGSANVQGRTSQTAHTPVSPEVHARPRSWEAQRGGPDSAPAAKPGTEAQQRGRELALALLQEGARPSLPARTALMPSPQVFLGPAKNPDAASSASIHIGTVEIRVAPPLPQPPVPHRPTASGALPALSRGFTSSFGLRQG